MSNIQLIIQERAANIGNFMVGRLLPFYQKRMVGPFIFIDHMGPVSLSDHENFDVASHPHIGLSTLTFLFEGSILHRDTLGNEIEIQPGAVNWMTAGKGIVHSERTPEYLRNSTKSLHGLQIWVALPKELENMDPEFFHIEKDRIPHWVEGDLSFKLIAGEAFGKKSAVPTYSKLFMIEIKSTTSQKVNIGKDFYGEAGMYILEGSVKSDGNIYHSKQILVAKESTLCEFEIEANTTIYIFGGEPFPEERYIFWNFVSSDQNTIEKAKKDWEEQNFDKIRGETGYVPLPASSNLKIKE
jgi:redox-sensitive bicupin YhaK (pirin superfamily)